MATTVLPTLFLSHGAPTLALDPGETGDAWRKLAAELPRPKAILCVSAHWMTAEPALSAPAQNETIHDFYGFPEPLYRMHYDPPATRELASRGKALLENAGINAALDMKHGLDHGAWVPLGIMYPDADIPTSQLSIQLDRDAAWHYRLGAALKPLRNEGVLILASGGAVHNLRALSREGGPALDWAREFDEWLADALTEGRTPELLDWTTRAPFAHLAQPSPDHFLPLFVALGAAGEGGRAVRIHQGFALGSLSMAGFKFT
ncbi:MAG TPA: class III extradiol ring-cleavage dioxygenase [Stellaceae bacterium]|nr:class III extradiol ring-cleavage dioxygenase [Stellaceae bacterium]